MTRCFSLAVAAALASTLGALSAADAKPLGKGVASWYGPGFHGKNTANGERFNTHALTAAHKTLPFGTQAPGHQRAHGQVGGGAHQRPWPVCPWPRDRPLESCCRGGRHLGVGQVTLAAL